VVVHYNNLLSRAESYRGLSLLLSLNSILQFLAQKDRKQTTNHVGSELDPLIESEITLVEFEELVWWTQQGRTNHLQREFHQAVQRAVGWLGFEFDNR
jgi:hypothetical protein